MPDPRTQEAIDLMLGFAEQTGLTSGRSPRRYLWTDAFAVCNFLGLARLTGEARYQQLALRLVDQVHHTLGRHRRDDSRRGWISGLGESEGEAHPTRGGLRIGKELPERGANVPFDERLEWERDGQYFHYLAQWMHALDQAARSTGRAQFNLWGRELAASAHHAFVYQPIGGLGPRRMVWKMSIDLTRPQVASMGQHDPLDGYVTALQLRSTAALLPGSAGGPGLEDETGQYEAMIAELATTDPLGIGGLLIDAYRLEQLQRQGAAVEEGLVDSLLEASLSGLKRYAASGELKLPAQYRLAFRELGLAIGLKAVQKMRQAEEREPGRSASRSEDRLQALMQYAPMGEAIEAFWREYRRDAIWAEHRDINEVMLATRLAPDGFLVLAPPPEEPARPEKTGP